MFFLYNLVGQNVLKLLFFFTLSFLAGVITRGNVPAFELMLWRICRGNVLLRTAEIDELTEDPTTVSQFH